MKLKGATVGDIVLSIVLPIVRFIAGLIALIKREYKRSVTMLALSGGMLAILAVPLVLLSTQGFAARLKQILTRKVCGSKDLGVFLQKNVVLNFVYRQKDGTPVAEVAVNRQACDAQKMLNKNR